MRLAANEELPNLCNVGEEKKQRENKLLQARQQTHNSFPCLSYVLTSFFRDHCVSPRLTELNCYLNMACHKLKTFAGGMRRINPAGMIFHCCSGELSANAVSAHCNLLVCWEMKQFPVFSLLWSDFTGVLTKIIMENIA